MGEIDWKAMFEDLGLNTKRDKIAGLILLGALQCGANKKRVRQYIYEKEETLLDNEGHMLFDEYWRRLRQNKILVKDKVCLDSDDLTISFCLAILCAQGLIRRVER